MDEEMERRFQAWLDTRATPDVLRAAFEAGAAAKAELLGEPAAYCVFCFRTVLLRGCQTRAEADWYSDSWNRLRGGGGLCEGDRAFVQPVTVLSRPICAAERMAQDDGTDDEGKGSD